MRTVSCPDCGHEIAVDDFITRQCPVCDSYMPLSNIKRRTEPELKSVMRVSPVVSDKLVEGGKEHGQDREPW